MALTFAQLSPDISQFTNNHRVVSELGKKVFGGVQTCRTLIALHQETAQLFHSFSFKANELHLRYRKLIPPSIFSSLGEMEGFLGVFLMFQNIFDIWSETTAELSNVLVNDCVVYMEQVVAQLERKRKEFFVTKKASDNYEMKTDEVLIPQNNVQKNVVSSSWTQENSPSDVEYPDSTLQSKGKSKIKAYSSELSPTFTGFTIKEDCYYMLDNWELIRLQSIKKMLKTTLQAFKRFQLSTEKLVNNFSRCIEAFHPEEDIQNWLRILLNDPTLFIAEKNNVEKTTVTFSNVIEHSSSSDTLVLRDSGFLEKKEPKDEIRTNGNGQYEVLSHLNNDLMRKASTEDEKMGGVETDKSSITAKNSLDQKTTGSVVHSSSSSNENRSDVLLRSQKTFLSHDSPFNEFPNLYDYLNRSITKISDRIYFERFFEIQRRLEEYLLSVASVDVNKTSLTTAWDDPYFQQSLPINDITYFYPYALPSGCVTTLSSRKNSMALEWGSVYMDEHQWNCLSYECLLLVYEYLHNEVVLMQSDKSYLKKKYQMPTNKPASKKKIQMDFNLLQKRKNNDTVSKTDSVRSQFDIDLCREVKTYDLQVISDLLTLARLKFGLSGQTNSIIYKLTLGGCVSNAVGYYTSLHPLDLRYRIVRLIDSWHAIENNSIVFSKPSEKTAFHEWVMRQIHIIHSGISFKFWRFLRFISKTKQVFNTLNFWPEHGPLYRFESYDFSSCFLKTTECIQPLIDRLIKAFLESFSILLNLSITLKMGYWGFMTDENMNTIRYSPRELLHLLMLMKSISFYDKTIRFHITQSERMETNVGKSVSEQIGGKDQNKKRKSGYGYSSNKHLKPHFMTLGSYWRYEAPMIQFFMSRLWCSVIDTSTPDFLNPDAPRLALGLLLTCHVMEYGVDHAGILQELADSLFFASLSLECHCFLLVKALWKEIISQPVVSGEENESRTSSYIFPIEALKMMLHLFSVNNFIQWIFSNMLQSTKKPLIPEFFSHQSKLLDHTYINTRTILAEKCNRLLLHSIMNPWIALTFHRSFNVITTGANKLDFYILDMNYLQTYVEELDTKEMCMCISHLISTANRLIHEDEITATTYFMNMDEPRSVNDKNLSLRSLQVKNAANRLMKQFKLLPFPNHETKQKINEVTNQEQFSPRKSKKEDVIGEGTKNNNNNNNKGDSRGVKSQVHLAYFKYYSEKANILPIIPNIKPCYSIRPEPEGLSLILPGRVERVTMEIFYNRQFLLDMITKLIDILSGYHNQLDPNSLPIALNILSELLNSFSKKTLVEPKDYDTASLNFSLPLSHLLKGPTDEHDYYRFFIHENIVRLINNLFKECRSALLTSKESKECHEQHKKISDVFILYSNVTCKLVNEIRGELLYFAAPWNQFLKGNQHAIIVMDATRKTLLGHFLELVNSMKSSQMDSLRHGFKLFQAIHKLEVLFWDAKEILNMNISLEPSLFQPFMEITQLSIQKKCNDMEVVIKRCVTKDIWQPVGHQSYSSSVLDFFTFLHTFIAALLESYIPIHWILDLFLSAFHRMVIVFCKGVLQDFKNIIFLHLVDEIETVFRTLRAPLGPQTDTLTEYQGFQSSEMSKYLPKSLKKANVFKFLKKKKKPLESKKSEKKIKKLTTNLTHDNDSLNDKELESSQYSDSSKTSDDMSISRTDGNTLDAPSKKVSKAKESSRRPFDLPEASFNHIEQRFGNSITLEYFTIQEYFRSISLKSCLVRFHNLSTFYDKLNEFYDFCLKEIEKQLAEKDICYTDLMETLTASNNAEKKTFENHPSNSLDVYKRYFENSLKICTTYLDDAQNELIRYVAFRIALVEFGEDFFETLYHPFFKDFKFENILNGLKDTVDWFILKLPHSVQQQFRFHIIEIFVKLWCFMISQTGLNGTIFLQEDLSVLKTDLNALVAYLQNLKTMPSPFKVLLYPASTQENENESNAFPIVLTDYVQEFFIWLSQHPSVLCDLGGMSVYPNATKTTKPSKKKQSLLPTQSSDNLISKSPTKLSDANLKSSGYFSVPQKVKHLKKKPMTWIENFF